MEDVIVAREDICSLCSVHRTTVEQLRFRCRLYFVRGRLLSTVCMARSGLRDAFVWSFKSETIEDHVLYHATVVSRCLRVAVLRDVLLVTTLSKTHSRLRIH